MVAISPASTYDASLTPLPLRRLIATFVLAAVIGSLAVAAMAGTQRARSGDVSLDAAGPAAAVSAPSVHLPVQAAGSGVHVVQPGDTLWTIARSFQPTGDVRPLVAELAKEMGNSPLQPGQRVAMPR